MLRVLGRVQMQQAARDPAAIMTEIDCCNVRACITLGMNACRVNPAASLCASRKSLFSTQQMVTDLRACAQ